MVTTEEPAVPHVGSDPVRRMEDEVRLAVWNCHEGLKKYEVRHSSQTRNACEGRERF